MTTRYNQSLIPLMLLAAICLTSSLHAQTQTQQPNHNQARNQQTYQQTRKYPNTYSPNQAGQQQYQSQSPQQIRQQAQYQAQAGQQLNNRINNTQQQQRPKLAIGKRVYPQGAPQNGRSLIIEKHAPVEVRPNHPFSYIIRIINPTRETMRNVVVKETQPATFRLISSVPQATSIKDGKQWALGDIPAASTREIQINGQVSDAKAQQIVSCVTVTHDVTGCWAIRVAEPKLKLKQAIPAVNLICDQLPLTLTVCNDGTGTARGIRVFSQLPEGITTMDGQTDLAVNVGDIPAGQCKELPIMLKAVRPANFTLVSSARSTDGQTSEATSKFAVQQPILTITKTGPKKRLLGRKVKYDITVTNKSKVTAKNVKVTDQVPAGVRVSGASSDGKLNQQTHNVLWQMGDLAAGASRKVSLELVSNKPGVIKNTATAIAECATPVTASAQTRIAGIPAILLEVIDIDDPIEVGENVTYMITVTNQGSATGTNIRIECTLEDTMQYVSSSGATMATPTDNKVIFDALPSLKPKNRASWKLVVRAVQPGDVRFMVKMTSDQISRHVVETEATTFYE